MDSGPFKGNTYHLKNKKWERMKKLINFEWNNKLHWRPQSQMRVEQVFKLLIKYLPTITCKNASTISTYDKIMACFVHTHVRIFDTIYGFNEKFSGFNYLLSKDPSLSGTHWTLHWLLLSGYKTYLIGGLMPSSSSKVKRWSFHGDPPSDREMISPVLCVYSNTKHPKITCRPIWSYTTFLCMGCTRQHIPPSHTI